MWLMVTQERCFNEQFICVAERRFTVGTQKVSRHLGRMR